jgi:IS1 family transposase
MSYNKVMANVLPRSKQLAILSALVDGNSIRSTERMLGVHRDTVMRLGAKIGEGCSALLDEMMVDLPCKRLELDELWAFVGKKQRHITAMDGIEKGDTWTLVAIDAETKLVPTFMTGKRDAETARAFIQELAARLSNRVQVTTDGLRTYIAPIAEAFGPSRVDYAQFHKTYESEPTGPGRYSPPRVTGTDKTPIFGFPIEDLVSTSYVERQNLTMRMSIRRFTRLTNAHSKKFENRLAAIALHFAHYNLVRLHSTLRATPAMAAGVTNTVWGMGELLDAALARTEEA